MQDREEYIHQRGMTKDIDKMIAEQFEEDKDYEPSFYDVCLKSKCGSKFSFLDKIKKWSQISKISPENNIQQMKQELEKRIIKDEQ